MTLGKHTLIRTRINEPARPTYIVSNVTYDYMIGSLSIGWHLVLLCSSLGIGRCRITSPSRLSIISWSPAHPARSVSTVRSPRASPICVPLVLSSGSLSVCFLWPPLNHIYSLDYMVHYKNIIQAFNIIWYTIKQDRVSTCYRTAAISHELFPCTLLKHSQGDH